MDQIQKNMKPLWVFLFLGAASRCVMSQVQLKESGPEWVNPSQTMSLTCKASGFSLTDYYIHWIRQTIGGGLEWVSKIRSSGSTDYSPTLQSRLSITRDTAKKEVYLNMRAVGNEDTARYYCARGHASDHSYYFDVWGSGTMVTVSSASMAKPTVFPLSVRTTDQLALICLVQSYFPEPVTVNWNYNEADATVRNFPAVQATGDSLYTMSSLLTLPSSKCPDTSSLSCQVNHYSNAVQNVAVPCKASEPTCCVHPSCCQPRLSMQRPAIEDLLLGSNASLKCTLSGLKDPKGATFTWKPSVGQTAIQKAPERDSCGCYSVTSVLPGCADPWNRGDTFTCTASHPDSKSALTVNLAKDIGNRFRPQVHLLPPPSEELALNEQLTLTCVARGFNPKEVMVRWLRENQELPSKDYTTWAAEKEPGQSDTTFAVTSILRVSAEQWQNGDNYSCMVGHEALPQAFTQKTINRLAGKPTHVNVSVIMAEAEGTCY